MRIPGLLASLIAVSAVAAGAQTPPAAEPPATPQSKPPGPEVMYACPGGSDFTATFSADGSLATLLVPGQPEIELSRLRSGAGFAYGDSYYELRGRGREATLTAAGRSLRCHAVGRPGQPTRTYQGDGLTLTLFPDGVFRLRERKPNESPVLDLGQWSQEVEGGARLVLRGGMARRAYREADGDRLIAGDGATLTRASTVDPVGDRFELAGLYRDTQNGGLFTECVTGRTYAVAPTGAEPDLERAWTEATPSKEAQLYVEILGRFSPGEVAAERFIALKAGASCPPQPPRSAALRDTEWRAADIDGQRPTFDDWRLRPKLTLDEQGGYTGATGCNVIEGRYQLDSDGIRFLAPTTTLAACPPALAASERRFLDALAAVRQAQIAGTVLDLLDESGKRRLRLDAHGR
ncbi:META domain-containing protein [Reyranella sp.]|uniref:META domain-containing protein n=1 Tax=Reyranella sp. TaxID=1929291 RepID=UPI003BAB0491